MAERLSSDNHKRNFMDRGSGPQTSVGLGQTKGCCSDGWMGQVTTRAAISSFCSDAAAQNSDRFNIRPFSVRGAAVSCTPLARSLLRPPPPFPQCAWRGLASNDHGVSREWHSGRQSGACAGTGAAEAPKERRGVGYDGRSRFHECRRHVSTNYSRSRCDFRLSSILQTRVGRRPPPGQLGASGAATCTSLSLCSTLPGLKLKAGCAVASLHAYESLSASFLKGGGALCVYPTA